MLNVNGPCNQRGESLLATALDLAFNQEGSETKCWRYMVSDVAGLILSWARGTSQKDGWQVTPGPMTAKQVLPMVLAYLDSDAAKACRLTACEYDLDHAGHNAVGWRVYVEDWGHVHECHTAICAVKPCFMRYGK